MKDQSSVEISVATIDESGELVGYKMTLEGMTPEEARLVYASSVDAILPSLSDLRQDTSAKENANSIFAITLNAGPDDSMWDILSQSYGGETAECEQLYSEATSAAVGVYPKKQVEARVAERAIKAIESMKTVAENETKRAEAKFLKAEQNMDPPYQAMLKASYIEESIKEEKARQKLEKEKREKDSAP